MLTSANSAKRVQFLFEWVRRVQFARLNRGSEPFKDLMLLLDEIIKQRINDPGNIYIFLNLSMRSSATMQQSGRNTRRSCRKSNVPSTSYLCKKKIDQKSFSCAPRSIKKVQSASIGINFRKDPFVSLLLFRDIGKFRFIRSHKL
ncbi:hypothetical protein LAZ67_3005792 [Cordylochernes scorpioides]|uniref:Uncharacterized protein n=1 Tax=Cordylochernes scorpioides TaxID=51811 RepID=A0ABY6KAU1_9ARAC|nr:hypothetical protein LAZ67_3005792 [Cordylochernes scorpioides]